MTKTATKPKAKLQYAIDGKDITNPSVNLLSGVAYFKTKGIDGKDRVSTDRLEEILAGLGVADPHHQAFDVELPNGKRLSATVIAEGIAQSAPTPPEVQPATSSAPTAKPAKAESERNAAGLTVAQQRTVDRVEAMKAERAAVKAWEDAGGDLSDMPKPQTPVSDEANAKLAAKDARAATKAAERAAGRSHRGQAGRQADGQEGRAQALQWPDHQGEPDPPRPSQAGLEPQGELMADAEPRGLAEAKAEYVRLLSEKATAERKLGRARDDHAWYEGLLAVLSHNAVRPPIEWDEVPRLLHQLQAFVARPEIAWSHLAGWTERSGGIWADPQATMHSLRRSWTRTSAIWVSKDIMATVIAAAESFPAEWHLEASDLPFGDGLAVLEDEFASDDYHGQNVALSAISWQPHIGRGTGRAGVVCWLHGMVANPPKGYPRLCFGWPRFIPFGTCDDDEPLTRLCAAFLLMIGQPIVESEERTARSATGSKRRRRHREDPVTALTLRRTRHESSAAAGTARDWQHRWVVSAHWRNQWYPSEGRHKTILVGPYVKGPDDKPLRLTERVYRWVR